MNDCIAWLWNTYWYSCSEKEFSSLTVQWGCNVVLKDNCQELVWFRMSNSAGTYPCSLHNCNMWTSILKLWIGNCITFWRGECKGSDFNEALKETSFYILFILPNNNFMDQTNLVCNCSFCFMVWFVYKISILIQFSIHRQCIVNSETVLLPSFATIEWVTVAVPKCCLYEKNVEQKRVHNVLLYITLNSSHWWLDPVAAFQIVGANVALQMFRTQLTITAVRIFYYNQYFICLYDLCHCLLFNFLFHWLLFRSVEWRVFQMSDGNVYNVQSYMCHTEFKCVTIFLFIKKIAWSLFATDATSRFGGSNLPLICVHGDLHDMSALGVFSFMYSVFHQQS